MDYFGLPALRPAGQPSAVQICSQQICRTPSISSVVLIQSLLPKKLVGASGLFRAPALRPSGRAYNARSKSLPAILSNPIYFFGGSHPIASTKKTGRREWIIPGSCPTPFGPRIQRAFKIAPGDFVEPHLFLRWFSSNRFYQKNW